MPARILRAAFTLTLGAVVIGAAAAPAAAQTIIRDSSPGDGTQVGALPTKVVVDFTGPVRAEGARVTVRGPAGNFYESGAAQVTAARVVQPLRPLGEAGRYNVDYRVVAADGQRVSGELAFTFTRSKVAKSPSPAITGQSQNPASPAPIDLSAGRDDIPPWIFVLGLAGAALIVTGAMWFGRWVTNDRD